MAETKGDKGAKPGKGDKPAAKGKSDAAPAAKEVEGKAAQGGWL